MLFAKKSIFSIKRHFYVIHFGHYLHRWSSLRLKNDTTIKKPNMTLGLKVKVKKVQTFFLLKNTGNCLKCIENWKKNFWIFFWFSIHFRQFPVFLREKNFDLEKKFDPWILTPVTFRWPLNWSIDNLTWLCIRYPSTVKESTISDCV